MDADQVLALQRNLWSSGKDKTCKDNYNKNGPMIRYSGKLFIAISLKKKFSVIPAIESNSLCLESGLALVTCLPNTVRAVIF